MRQATVAVLAVFVWNGSALASGDPPPSGEYLRLEDFRIFYHDASLNTLVDTGINALELCPNREQLTLASVGVCLDIDAKPDGFVAIMHIAIVGTSYEVSWDFHIDGTPYRSCSGGAPACSPSLNQYVTYWHSVLDDAACGGLSPGHHVVTGELEAHDSTLNLSWVSTDEVGINC